VGAAAQFTAIDFAQSTAAIATLVNNADFRRKLGAQAQARAREIFDWSAIIPQYQALWAELNARRTASRSEGPVRENPFHPDPFRLFAAHPTRHFTEDWQVALAPGMDAAAARALLASPLAAYSQFNRPTLDECERVVGWLAERPGARVSDLLQILPAGRRSTMSRGLLWIARYGVVVLQPPG